MKSEVVLGIFGMGVVGSGVIEMLQANRCDIEQKSGVKLRLKKIVVRDLKRARRVPVDSALLSEDPNEILNDPEIDVVVELMGGVHPAKEYVVRALENGKQVVTANKELIAKEGATLMHLAAHANLDFQFEGSVGGGIPIIQPMKNALAGNQVTCVMGIVNGTTNYILSQMAQEGKDFPAALAEAQAKGYAELDPASDVDGHDAAYKLAILSSIAFTSRVDESQVYREGITNVQSRDIECARGLGYAIKLLAIAKANSDGTVQARVHPTLIPQTHPLASVSDVYNAVLVNGDFVGDVMFYGQGAGSRATASAVVGDIVDVCRNLRFGSTGRVRCTCYEHHPVVSIDQAQSKYYLRMIAQDRPKVIASIANVFGNCGISIESLQQRPLSRSRSEFVWITHQTQETQFKAAVRFIRELSIVEQIANWFRVEENERD